MDSPAVARIGVDAVEAGRTRVVVGGVNRLVAGMCKYLPEPLARALVAGKSKDFRSAE
jgi:hypothetical protein